MALVVGAIGVVYGDIGTSPLYMLRTAFGGNDALATTPANVYGVLSVVFWALVIIVTLKYGNARERSIAGIKRVSKPGLRVYAKKDNLPRVLGGLGVAIISTSSGLMTDKQAKKNGVGGEVLAYVW